MMKHLQAVIFLLFSANLFAHGLHLSAQYDGQQITGKAYYSDQTPAVETYIEAVKVGDSDPVVYGKTDKQGNFTLPTTAKPPFKVIVEGMEGHRAEVDIQASEEMTGLASQAEFQALRADIDQLKNKLFWRDILGGIGYIFGLFGVVALLKAKKGNS